MTSSNSSLSFNTKLVISTVAIAGMATCGYYCYKKIHSNNSDTCTTTLWSSSCLYMNLKNCINASNNRLYSFFGLSKKESNLDDSIKEPFSLSYLSKMDYSLAKAKKSLGNKLFSDGKFNEAIDCYSEAIINLPEDHPERSICYCNRAACYLSQGLYQLVISDCTEALRFSPLYLKAFERRSRAKEALGDLREALADLTACCVLDGFSSQIFPQRLEKLLRTVSQSLSAEIIEVSY